MEARSDRKTRDSEHSQVFWLKTFLELPKGISLHDTFGRIFAHVEHSYAKTVNKGHGRIETRECWAIENAEYLALIRKHEQWKGLKSIVRIISRR